MLRGTGSPCSRSEEVEVRHSMDEFHAVFVGIVISEQALNLLSWRVLTTRGVGWETKGECAHDREFPHQPRRETKGECLLLEGSARKLRASALMASADYSRGRPGN